MALSTFNPRKPPVPSRPSGTPLALPLAPSRPTGTPIGIPIAPTRPAGTPIGVPLAPIRPAGTDIGLPTPPSTSGTGAGVALRQPPLPPAPASVAAPPPAPASSAPTTTTTNTTGHTESTSTAAAPPTVPAPARPLPPGAIRIPPDDSPIEISVGTAIPRREVHVPQVRVGAGPARSLGDGREEVQDAQTRARKRPAPAGHPVGPAPKRAKKSANAKKASTATTSETSTATPVPSTSAPAATTEAQAPPSGSESRRRSARVAARAQEGDAVMADADDDDADTPAEEDYDDAEEEAEAADTAPKAQAKKSRKRKPSAPPNEDDPEAEARPARAKRRRARSPSLSEPPGEPLDAHTTTMADILRDPGVGRVSNRFVEAYRAKQRLNAERKKEREERMREVVRRKEEMREAVERGLEVEQRAIAQAARDAAASAEGGTEVQRGGMAAVQAALLAAAAPAGEEEDTGPFQETHSAPQIRIGAGGEWEVDEEHLLIDRSADPALLAQEEYETIEERESDRFVTSFTWSRKRLLAHSSARGGRWTREEVDLLCKGVGMFGYDFEMISRMFVGRNRQVVKNKWKRIEKEQPERAAMAWESREAIGESLPWCTFFGLPRASPPVHFFHVRVGTASPPPRLFLAPCLVHTVRAKPT
ncbi:hypothetical protein CALCODRAFT_455561 [Calocera cornea HHB12733]|uniref:Uncharacterized protein n=1 Tax=Calocera cornea HHB12733 TaxID=1353952 RepID=A0A165ESC4_9BASI|nr:hypothetical protein CALCODRAFT_455561 [Calocera cornea HHB12733]